MPAGQGKQGGQWAEFLWGLIVGLQLSLASYAFGERCALIVDRYLVPGGRAETDLERIEDRYVAHPSCCPSVLTLTDCAPALCQQNSGFLLSFLHGTACAVK